MKYVVLMILISFFQTRGQTQEVSEYVSYPVVKNFEIKNFQVQQGIYDHSFTLSDKSKWSVNIFIPEIKPNTKVPLILAMHWAGSDQTYKEYSKCLAFPALNTLNAIIIVPSSGGKHWVNPEIEERVIRLVKQIIKYWPIDDDKVLITGYSNGGIASWEYTKKYPKIFSAAIPMAGYYSSSKIKRPIYAIHGADDELFNSQEIKLAIEHSNALGSNIKLEIIPDHSHYMACSKTYITALQRSAEKVVKEW